MRYQPFWGERTAPMEELHEDQHLWRHFCLCHAPAQMLQQIGDDVHEMQGEFDINLK